MVRFREGGRRHAGLVRIKLHYEAAVHTAPGERMDSEETFVLRSELLVASCSDGIVGCCTLSAEDPEFWPDALKGEAAYLHKLAVRRTHAGRGVSSALIEACRHAARTQGCAKLRLDCHPNLRGLYERLGFTHVDTFNPGWDPTFIAERLELEI
ncbi:GNAT family N-acetyltransferase [Shigella flexneri]